MDDFRYVLDLLLRCENKFYFDLNFLYWIALPDLFNLFFSVVRFPLAIL